MNLFMQGNGYEKWNEPVLPEVFFKGREALVPQMIK